MVICKKTVRASTIVEMAFLMPVVLLAWMLILLALFYYHDKNILSGAAYETAVVGSEILHGTSELPEGELSAYFQERIRGKLLYFGGASVQISGGETEIVVRVRVAAKGRSLLIERKATVSLPEKWIRRRHSGKQFVEDVIS